MLIPLRRPGDAGHDILHTGYGHAVPKGFVPGGVRGTGKIRPAGRKALERLTFLWGEPPDEEAAGASRLGWQTRSVASFRWRALWAEAVSSSLNLSTRWRQKMACRSALVRV